MSQPVLECNNPWETECNCGTRYAPCWPRPDTSCCDRLEPENPTPEQTARIERMLHVATEIMWRLSGKQFGGCPVTVRPCRQKCAGATMAYGYWSGGTWTPVLDGGQWYNERGCGKCAPSGCSCTELCEVTLPGLVSEVLQVKQDGLVLDPSEYRLDNSRQLVRTSFGPLILDEWQDLGGGLAVATQSDVPAHSVQAGGGAVVTDGKLSFPAQAGPYVVNMGLPNRAQQRIRFRLEPWAELTFPNTWSVEAIEPLGPSSTVFQLSPTEVRGGQFGGWVLLTGTGQSPVFSLPDGPNGIGEPRGGAAVEYVSYVDDNRPGACWPTCQDLSKPDTEAGTFSVRIRPGTPVPQGGLWAAGLLACQLLKACDEDAECALPVNARRIARQGVTVEMTPLFIDREAGGFMTGIPEVDLWLESVNPYKSKMPSRVYSVDRPRPRVQTWPC